MAKPPPLSRLGLNAGKKARLHRILFQHGLGNATALFLPDILAKFPGAQLRSVP
jgi:class I fructose-bisphosphate aldolase